MRVSTILDNIDAGAIALPEFQRGYVWNRSQVRGLMDSMYRGHPIGSLLTWQTQTEAAVARGDQRLQPGTVQLLLDGQQRITTLYSIIRGEAPRFFEGDARVFRDLHFHLDEQVFEYWQPVKMRDDTRWTPVTDLLKEGPGAMIAGVFAEAGSDPDKLQQAQLWLERLNRIDQIKDRELHIELITGEDKTVDVVVDIFNRVNSGGTKLSKGDLALAKICAEWPEAREQMSMRIEKWRAAGYELRLDLLLRVVNAIITGRAPLSALAGRRPQEISEGLERAERAIDKILNTLASRLGLDHGSVAPAIAAFPLMARYLSDRDFAFADHRERDRLLYWYAQVAMWGRYAGSTETVLAQDLQAITTPGGDPVGRLIAGLRQQRGDLHVQPGDFRAWSRGARFYPILYMLTRIDGARDWGSDEQLDRHALGRYTDLEIHHIFPKHVLYQAGYERSEVNAIANFTFLSAETNRAISDRPPEEYLPELMLGHPGAVESHWMPLEPRLWKVENYPEFLERRRTLLAQATNALLDRLLHGHQPDRETSVGVDAAGPSLIVTDEEERSIADLREWITSQGFDSGEPNHELVDADGTVVAVLDLAWPRGLQAELSEPIALLLDEPAEVYRAAVRYGYRPFTNIEELRTWVADMELLAANEPAGV